MKAADLVDHVATLAASRLAPRAAVTTLAPLLAAFATHPDNRHAAGRLRGRVEPLRVLLNHPADDFRIVVVSWAPGRRTPIHDHAGATGAVATLVGSTTETRYRIVADDGAGVTLVEAGRTHIVGRVIAPLLPEDGHQLHEMAHAEGDPAVTVHVYLQALDELDIYEPQPDGRHRRRVQRFEADEVQGWRGWAAGPLDRHDLIDRADPHWPADPPDLQHATASRPARRSTSSITSSTGVPS